MQFFFPVSSLFHFYKYYNNPDFPFIQSVTELFQRKTPPHSACSWSRRYKLLKVSQKTDLQVLLPVGGENAHLSICWPCFTWLIADRMIHLRPLWLLAAANLLTSNGIRDELKHRGCILTETQSGSAMIREDWRANNYLQFSRVL